MKTFGARVQGRDFVLKEQLWQNLWAKQLITFNKEHAFLSWTYTYLWGISLHIFTLSSDLNVNRIGPSWEGR